MSKSEKKAKHKIRAKRVAAVYLMRVIRNRLVDDIYPGTPRFTDGWLHDFIPDVVYDSNVLAYLKKRICKYSGRFAPVDDDSVSNVALDAASVSSCLPALTKLGRTTAERALRRGIFLDLMLLMEEQRLTKEELKILA